MERDAEDEEEEKEELEVWNCWERRASRIGHHRNSTDGAGAVSAARKSQRGHRRTGVYGSEGPGGLEREEVSKIKSISVAHLVWFYRKYEGSNRLSAETTCAAVQDDIVVPETQGVRCAFVDTLTAAQRPPDAAVCHWGGLPFRELVLAVVQHAGATVLDPGAVAARVFGEQLDIGPVVAERRYWICMFSMNLHADWRAGGEGPSMVARLLRSLPAALFVLDREAVILSRAWCAFELYAAAAEGDGAVDFGGHLADRFREDDVLFSGVELCKTSSTYDKDCIARIVREGDGFDTFNEECDGFFKAGAQLVVWRRALCQSDMPTMRRLLERRADVNWQVTPFDTALTWACQYGVLALVSMLLTGGAEVNLAAASGAWTPLHHAVHVGARFVVSELLAARANANAAAQNGRTPLVDAAERGYGSITELLLEAGADIHATDRSGLTVANFALRVGDQGLMERLGWTSEMQQEADALGRQRSSVWK